MDKPKLKIYTDGSCKPNPGTGGWAFVVFEDDVKISSHGGAEKGTNSYRIELTAVLSAMKSYKSYDGPVLIFTDCIYVVDTLNKDWLKKWYHKKLNVNQIRNSDLLTKIYSLSQKHKNKFEIRKVKGHSGIPGNEIAHKRARAEVKKFNKGIANKKHKKKLDKIKKPL